MVSIKGILIKIKNFIIELKRVWTITRKPTKDELKVIVKVTGIGILIIGLIGLLINMMWQLIFK